MKMRFNSPYFHDDMFFSNSGTPTVPDYQLDFGDDGIPYLKQVGEIPLFEKIQAERSNCELESVLKSCVTDSQLNVLDFDGVNDLVADFTGLKSLGDVYLASKRMENSWLDLPLEVREQFDSSMHKFVSLYGSEEGSKLMQDGYRKYYNNIRNVNKVGNPESKPFAKPESKPVEKPESKSESIVE